MHPITTTRRDIPVITCEHGGRVVPRAYAALFVGQQAVLDSHRGWDPGALALGRQMARALDVPLHAAATTRLLVELNRSIAHPSCFRNSPVACHLRSAGKSFTATTNLTVMLWKLPSQATLRRGTG